VEATRFLFKSQGGGNVDIPDEERQTQWSRDIFEVGRRGLHVDVERLQTLIRPAADRISELRVQLRSLGIIQPRGPKHRCGCGECDGGAHIWRDEAVSEKRIVELLRSVGATRKANKGHGVRLAMDAEAFRDSGLAELAVLAEFDDEEKWLSLLEGYNIPGGVVRTRYNSLVTTGRMSSSGPNVQQVPKAGGLRECWIPSPGNVFVEADYPGLELYTFADTCRHWDIRTQMGDWLDAGVSVHTMIAEQARMSRDLAKILNFGGLGGMGPATMVANAKKQGLVVSLEDMTQTMSRWRRALPEIWQYRGHCERIRRNERYLVTSPQSGRSRLAYYCASLNFPFQSAGSDVTKRAVELCLKAQIPVVAVIHDQLLADVPAADAHDVGVKMVALMMQAHQEICTKVKAPQVHYNVFLDRWKSKG
jgi:predicted HAD superfamily phosphohydrolase YqeG